MKDAAYWIEKLDLKKHPEGGYFRQTYRSAESIEAGALPSRFNAGRPISTAIYYLLDADEFSAFHSLKSDELWHFYSGVAITMHVIDQKRGYSAIRLGSDFEHGEVFQAVVEAGCWFGAAVDNSNHGHASCSCSSCSPPARSPYSLVGCTVAPGFDFSDFRLGDRRKLIERYPEHKAIIEKLSR
jgi:predicted cupin superfamily sugar epimerase